MNSRVKENKRWLLVLSLVVSGAIAAGVSIDGRSAPYSGRSNIAGTSIDSDWEIRNAGLSQAAAIYRQQHGPSSLPAGSNFRMTWPNGSSEGGSVTSPYLSDGAVPIPGTQQPPLCGDCPPTQTE
jgi:hypothetical protein